jgi:MFS family permease
VKAAARVADSPAPRYGERDFPVYLGTRFLSNVALLVQSVAVGWHVYDLERTPLALGLVGLSEFLPMFLLTLPAGEIADRFDPRKVLAASLALEALCSTLLLAVTAAHVAHVWPLYAIMVLFGCARGFSGPAVRSLLPFLVPAERLPKSIAWSSSVAQVAIIAGPAIGGFVYALGPAFAYGLCLAIFLAAALGTATLGGRRSSDTGASAAGRLARVKEGIHFVRSRPIVLGAISLDLFAVLLGGATALLPVFARDILHVGPAGLGMLRSAPAVGAAVVALFLTRRPAQHRIGRRLFVSVAIFGVATIVFGLSTHFALSLLSLVILGASDQISVYIRTALLQFATPDPMRGRVSAVSTLFIGASNELGGFESGVTAALLGTVPAVIVGGVGTLIVVVAWMRLFPQLTRVDRLTEVIPT